MKYRKFNNEMVTSLYSQVDETVCDYCGNDYGKKELRFIDFECMFFCNNCLHRDVNLVCCDYCGKEYTKDKITYIEDDGVFCCKSCMKAIYGNHKPNDPDTSNEHDVAMKSIDITKQDKNVNSRQKNGSTELMRKARDSDDINILKLLIESKADIFATDNAGNNVFWFAQKNDKLPKDAIIDLLSNYIDKISFSYEASSERMEITQKLPSILDILAQVKSIEIGYLKHKVFCDGKYLCMEVEQGMTIKIPITNILIAYKNRTWRNIASTRNFVDIYTALLAKGLFNFLQSK